MDEDNSNASVCAHCEHVLYRRFVVLERVCVHACVFARVHLRVDTGIFVSGGQQTKED